MTLTACSPGPEAGPRVEPGRGRRALGPRDSPSGGRTARWGPGGHQARTVGAGRGASSLPGPTAAGSGAPWPPAPPARAGGAAQARLCGRRGGDGPTPVAGTGSEQPANRAAGPGLTGEPTLSTRASSPSSTPPGVLTSAAERAQGSRAVLSGPERPRSRSGAIERGGASRATAGSGRGGGEGGRGSGPRGRSVGLVGGEEGGTLGRGWRRGRRVEGLAEARAAGRGQLVATRREPGRLLRPQTNGSFLVSARGHCRHFGHSHSVCHSRNILLSS